MRGEADVIACAEVRKERGVLRGVGQRAAVRGELAEALPGSYLREVLTLDARGAIGLPAEINLCFRDESASCS